jgi:hypothetical protein
MGPTTTRAQGSPRRSGGSLIAAALCLACYVLVTRFAFLDVDPPPSLQLDILSDEGWWAHNAKLRSRFGSWMLDDHNPPLFGAPLYTATLHGVYEVLGTGRWQTRFLAALSGAASCLLVFLLVRRHASPRAALLAAGLCATDGFLTLHQRVGFVESFQLPWMLGSVLAFSRGGSARHAALAGLLFLAAVLAKLSAVGLGFVFAVCWGRALLARDPTRRPILEACAFLAGFVVPLTIVVVALVLPNVEACRRELVSGWTEASGGDLWKTPLNAVTFGISTSGVALNGFLRQSWPLVAGVVLLVLERLLHPRGGGTAGRGMGFLESLCWTWVLVLAAFVAMQHYQPDRRLLPLVPPMAILLALRLDAGGTLLAHAGTSKGRLVVAASVLAVAAGMFARPLVFPAIEEPLASLLGKHPVGRWAAGASWAVGTVIAWPLCASLLLLARRAAVGIPAWCALLVLLIPGPVRFVSDAASATWTLAGATEHLRALTADWPPERRVAVGDLADTLTLDLDILPIVIRDWPHLHMAMNLDAWERFRPSLALWNLPPVPELDAFHEVAAFDIGPDQDGRPRLRVRVYVRD